MLATNTPASVSLLMSISFYTVLSFLFPFSLGDLTRALCLLGKHLPLHYTPQPSFVFFTLRQGLTELPSLALNPFCESGSPEIVLFLTQAPW